MAEVELTALENGEEGAEGGEQSGKGGMNKLILFGGIGLGAVVIGVVLALFVIKPMMAGSSEEATEDGTEEVIAGQDHEAEESSDGHGEDEEGEHGSGGSSLIYAVNDIVVNPAGTGGSRFLSCSIAFELANSKIHREFESKDALVRDALITILSSKTVPQLTVPKQKEIVRYQIKKRLEKLLHSDDLVGVYFTDFVLQ